MDTAESRTRKPHAGALQAACQNKSRNSQGICERHYKTALPLHVVGVDRVVVVVLSASPAVYTSILQLHTASSCRRVLAGDNSLLCFPLVSTLTTSTPWLPLNRYFHSPLFTLPRSVCRTQVQYASSSCGLLPTACEACPQLSLLCNHDTLLCHAAGLVPRQHKFQSCNTLLPAGSARCVAPSLLRNSTFKPTQYLHIY